MHLCTMGILLSSAAVVLLVIIYKNINNKYSIARLALNDEVMTCNEDAENRSDEAKRIPSASSFGE